MNQDSEHKVQGQEIHRSTEVSIVAGVPGILSVQATHHFPIEQYLNTFKYSRQLSKVVKMHGQIEGMTVEFPSGRSLLNWEIGLFCDLGTTKETLSIVATHFLYTKYMHLLYDENSGGEDPIDQINTYSYSIDGLGLNIIHTSYINRRLGKRQTQAKVSFRTIREIVYSRLAIEITFRRVLKEIFPKLTSTHTAASISNQFWNLRLEINHSQNTAETAFMEVNEEWFLVGGFPDDGMVRNVVDMFSKTLKGFINNEKDVPQGYMIGTLNTIFKSTLTGDKENDFRIRYFLKTGKHISIDSSKLLARQDIRQALDSAKEEWRRKKMQRWTNRSERVPDNFSYYDMITKALINESENIQNGNQNFDELWPYWEQRMKRRDTLKLLASSRPQRNTVASMEKIWFQNLFDTAGYKQFSKIKRKRQIEIVESRTDYFVVVPIDRKIVVWTKNSLYNSFKLPWKSLVQSQISIPAVSAMCLFSSCIYPNPSTDPRLAGNATIDKEEFSRNVAKTENGLGYAISTLPEVYKENQLREQGNWCLNSLKLSSLVSLIWKQLFWLDNESKAWITRETMNLLALSNVNIYVSAHPGIFPRTIFFVEDEMLLPCLHIDCKIPAGGISVFMSVESGEKFIKINGKYLENGQEQGMIFEVFKERNLMTVRPVDNSRVNIIGNNFQKRVEDGSAQYA